MEAADEGTIVQVHRDLLQIFGLYKAEWMDGQLFDLFTEPEYFDELRTGRPCVLIGGRGTGKTTVLKGLSYEGQLALSEPKSKDVTLSSYFGIYYRIDTNRVAAFKGRSLDEDGWVRYFAHYVNLVMCGALLDFVIWYEEQSGRSIKLKANRLDRVARSLHVKACRELVDLREEVYDALVDFEAVINNIADQPSIRLSMQGSPIDELVAALRAHVEFSEKIFYLLIDEYENLQDYQQKVFNTLLKHAAGKGYTFKIGVKELGWRVRATLNETEQLSQPADYVRIKITEELGVERFERFALRVCKGRLQRLAKLNEEQRDIRWFFPSLSLDEEAVILGAGEGNLAAIKDLLEGGHEVEAATARSLSTLSLFLLRYYADLEARPLLDLLTEFDDQRSRWEGRMNNYAYSALFTLRRNKPGIRKFYSGWRTLLQLADGNIRFLLQLVHAALTREFSGDERGGLRPIAPDKQTRGAQDVGKSNLDELSGISVEGARLTKLLLALGRIFQLLAQNPERHAPEINQFHVVQPDGELAENKMDEVRHLLDAAVMHLALVRAPGTKLMDDTDIREYDYWVHPVFAPYFVFSYRRKRKLQLTPEQVLGLVRMPQETIREVLAQHGREPLEDMIPDQLRLFEGFYGHAG